MSPKQCAAKVISNCSLNSEFYNMVLLCPEIAEACRPGQFVMVDTGLNHVPYLKRPLAIASAAEGTIRLIFKSAGTGTRLLSKFEKGRSLTVIGPLGNGYTLPKAGASVLLAAGGAGISSILSLLQELKRLDCVSHVVFGARNKAGLLCVDELNAAGTRLHIATEDGSAGFAGFPTPLVQALLEKEPFDNAYLCGPTPMMRAVAPVVIAAGVPCQVSMERRMGCGFGVCVGCSCKLKGPDGEIFQRRVCKEGPVFQAEEVVWDG